MLRCQDGKGVCISFPISHSLHTERELNWAFLLLPLVPFFLVITQTSTFTEIFNRRNKMTFQLSLLLLPLPKSYLWNSNYSFPCTGAQILNFNRHSSFYSPFLSWERIGTGVENSKGPKCSTYGCTIDYMQKE